MTLKSYTDFVVKFTLATYGVPTLATKQEKKRLRFLIEEFKTLIGPENWEKLIDIFLKKLGFPEKRDKHAYIPEYILWDKNKFTETLAEFCEPLIGKEEPKGGQDAAKA
ncbi:MAG: hypothetical protein AAB355_02895 [Patescibacteria group bacterium]